MGSHVGAYVILNTLPFIQLWLWKCSLRGWILLYNRYFGKFLDSHNQASRWQLDFHSLRIPFLTPNTASRPWKINNNYHYVLLLVTKPISFIVQNYSVYIFILIWTRYSNKVYSICRAAMGKASMLAKVALASLSLQWVELGCWKTTRALWNQSFIF